MYNSANTVNASALLTVYIHLMLRRVRFLDLISAQECHVQKHVDNQGCTVLTKHNYTTVT